MKPHIQFEANARFKRAIVCGPPERAAAISEYLEGAVPLAKNREYHSYIGKFQGQDVIVISHGVGAPGATICFQELIDVGVTSIIRVGTAGGLMESSDFGDVVVATGAIRKDGVSLSMVPLGFPAVPDFALTAQIQRELAQVPFKAGIVLTSDLFYPGVLDPEWALYQKAGAVAVEMECSALFVTGSLRGVRTASALVLDGNPLKWKDGKYAPKSPRVEDSFKRVIPACLRAIVRDGAS